MDALTTTATAGVHRRSPQPALFDLPPEPRAPRRVLMHVYDAGDCDSSALARFRCAKCGRKTDWLPIQSTTQAKRGIPCPRCNAAPQ